MSLKDDILLAARADNIPEGRQGVWTVRKFETSKPLFCPRDDDGAGITLAPGRYTQLFCFTMESAMQNQGLGDLVMHDYPQELAKHLDFMLRAHGDVLITGLGLGCVARGCLANPAVKSITVIERSMEVIRLVWPHMPHLDRATLIRSDALEWCNSNDRKFDCAWHDLWSNPDKDEPHLQVTHGKLIASLFDRVKKQGAWELPRWARRLYAAKGGEMIG